MKQNKRKQTEPAPFSVPDWPAARVEMWKPIPDLNNYEASSLGRIRSLTRQLVFEGRWGTTRRTHRSKVLRLKPKPNGWGAVYFQFYSDGGVYWHVNRAVCMAFHGPAPSRRHEAAHIDGNTTNNQPENLTWATPKENAAHKVQHGTAPIGEKNAASRLQERDIKLIFEAYCFGVAPEDIAARFQITRSNVIQIVRGSTWKNVQVGELRAAAKLRAKTNMERTWRAAAIRMEELGPSLKPAA